MEHFSAKTLRRCPGSQRLSPTTRPPYQAVSFVLTFSGCAHRGGRRFRHALWCCNRLSDKAAEVTVRRGTAADADKIARMTVKEGCARLVRVACSMSPLGLKPDRFVVAVQGSGEGAGVLGFGQLQPHGDPQRPDFLELRTLIVDPAHRGKGIGTQVVKELLRSAGSRVVYLTTLQRTIPFYSPHGFTQLPLNPQSVPRSLWFEVAAGLVVARLVTGQPLVVLKRGAPSSQ